MSKDKNKESQFNEEAEINTTKETTEEAQHLEDENAESARVNDEVSELRNKYLRLLAEFDNYKKRSARERIELIGSAAKDTMSALLPVLDDFDRAKSASEAEGSNEAFPEGVQLVYNKLYSVLEKRGLNAMDSNGKVFDSELHEAITEVPVDDEMKGKVVDTIEKGYFLNDKIIRHAKVVVGK